MDIYPPTLQRQALLKLAPVLDIREKSLRRDECGDWRINGHLGHVYAVPDGYLLVCLGESARRWTNTKKALKGPLMLLNDGDEEGAFLLRGLPSPEVAEAIRDRLKIARRKHYSEETIAVLSDRMKNLSVRAA